MSGIAWVWPRPVKRRRVMRDLERTAREECESGDWFYGHAKALLAAGNHQDAALMSAIALTAYDSAARLNKEMADAHLQNAERLLVLSSVFLVALISFLLGLS